MKFLHHTLTERKISVIEYLLIVITALIPLFFNHPYRINLFLAWEGAYRIANGEIPYRDFGSPVGYGFWILPALFFKIFGPYVYTLLIVQAFINIVSGITFRALLKRFGVPPAVGLLSLLVYCLSYSMFNFWPWYNHLVFVFEIIGFYFLGTQILKGPESRNIVGIVTSAFFIALSFMTKQDTGALALLVSLGMVIIDALWERKFKTIAIFAVSYLAFMALFILPFLKYDFMYWFNLGQFPHNARVDKFDIVNELLGGSDMIKFYLLIIAIAILFKLTNTSNFKEEKSYFLFSWLVLAILGQASIIQVTSYTPIDGNIYYHSFAFAFIVFHFSRHFDMARTVNLALLSFLVCLWWSGFFWTRFLREHVQKFLVDKSPKEHVISKRTYLLSNDTTTTAGIGSVRSKWIVPPAPSFKRIRIPESTALGIEQIRKMPISQKKDLKILNMSELTSLAYDMGYTLETGPLHPLWYHKGVAFFEREVDRFCNKISAKEYDIILFEDIPNVNQFYPYQVRDCIKENYIFKFKFLAPRIPEISYIEVYERE